MKKAILALLLSTILLPLAGQTIQSPDQFLGYPLGSKFTFHHRVVSYYEHVAEASAQVQLQPYGETYEGRPLMVAFVSTAANLAQLETIRQDNLRRAGVLEGSPSTNVAIVWLSYNVHGNEANSTEASLKTLYELVNEGGKAWLENTVVVLDPCINPDGRDRYVNFYTQRGHQTPNPDVNSEEHEEGWRPGRSNHYLFDLNRDWVWLEQQESQQRIALYNQWLPHVHVDFHEQFRNSPYYFAPAAEPFHQLITDWQREFQTTIGKNNARYFDENNWLYFTKESFDLFYPSYGDTYPTFNGAIGMTYEQAGHGSAGLAVKINNGDTLTLLDRLTHHHTTGMATIETTSQHATDVLREFEKYFSGSAASPEGKYKSFVISASNNRDKLTELTSWLDKLGIQYGTAGSAKKVSGFHYTSQQNRSYTTQAEDIIINAYQPKSVLVQVLFEPEPYLSDSLTYDITAWAIPYAHGLDGYALTSRIDAGASYAAKPLVQPSGSESPYAYVARWQSLEDARFLGQLFEAGVQVRFASEPFGIAGKQFDRGSLIILRTDNEPLGEDFDRKVTELSTALNRELTVTTTGFVDSGKDFGSGSVNLLSKPQVAVLNEGDVSSLAFGEVWHLFEQQLHYPLTVLTTSSISDKDLSAYDVLIVPSGYYGSTAAELKSVLTAYVSNGGKVILIGGANSLATGEEGFGLSTKARAEPEEEEPAPSTLLRTYGSRQRDFASYFTAGAIYRAQLDTTHPLAFGYSSTYYNLNLSSSAYNYLSNGWNVGYIPSNNGPVAGFAGKNLRDRLQEVLVFGVQDAGEGTVVYMVDNPLFRSFWQNGKLLMANAVFLVGQD